MGRAPLAERVRPRDLSEFVGQEHLLGEGRILNAFVKKKRLPSLILWGPPGCGKTTLARLLAKSTEAAFVSVSAVDSGIKELRKVVEDAKRLKTTGRSLILFIDEIHRFNKAQQDFLLPYVESGLITLIGATTENPSFEVIPPLLSRCKVLTLKPLEPRHIKEILKKALEDERGYRGEVEVEEEVLEVISEACGGDARVALNTLETLVEGVGKEKKITVRDLESALLERPLLYDKSGEEHYNLISAFHKSLRGSDPDAALYWLARMLEAGEDPLYIARRIVVAASEDVGNADPMALVVAVAAKEAFEFLGSPEGEIALAQAAVYVACAPKSNAVYQGLKKAKEDAKSFGALPVPLHLRNPVTALMRALGYGKGYKYPHDFEEGFVEQAYLPEALKDKRYYRPKKRGYERRLALRLKRLWKGKKG